MSVHVLAVVEKKTTTAPTNSSFNDANENDGGYADED
jgi:hypothetical protein